MCNAYINTPKIKLHMSAVGILIHLGNLNQFTKKMLRPFLQVTLLCKYIFV